MNQIGTQSGHIIATLGGLFLFGMLYAHLVNRLHRWGYSEGYTAILVIFGTLITLIGSTLLHQPNPINDFLMTLACFAASGTPMALNDMLQYARARNKEQHTLAGEKDQS